MCICVSECMCVSHSQRIANTPLIEKYFHFISKLIFFHFSIIVQIFTLILFDTLHKSQLVTAIYTFISLICDKKKRRRRCIEIFLTAM